MICVSDETFRHEMHDGADHAANQDLQRAAFVKPLTDDIMSSAIMTVIAFRMRDEQGLISALRRLSDVVGELEASNDNQPG